MQFHDCKPSGKGYSLELCAPTIVHSALFQCIFSRAFCFVADASKHFYIGHCLQNTLSSSLKEQLQSQEQKKEGRVCIQAHVCCVFLMALCLQRTFSKEEGGFLVSF